jgi:YVTN family beta-propeller protein
LKSSGATAMVGMVLTVSTVLAGQAPDALTAVDVPISHHDRVYAAAQFSNTVSVTDPVTNELLGVIRLGESQPANFSPLYRGQVLVHGLGYSPDHRTLAVVSIGSNSVSFVDTASNTVKHTTYLGRSPHEAFFTPDGRELWVTVRGEDYVSALDPVTYVETGRIKVPNGPGMQIFSPDGRYGYVCSSFTPETVVVSVSDHRIVGRVKQESPFCPNIAATPDGRQVWMTLKDIGKVEVFEAQPPFSVLTVIATGPITNHVNFAHVGDLTFAYVTVGALNQVKVYRTDTFAPIATIEVGSLPHGIWPSGDGRRMFVGLENGDSLVAIDTSTNTVVASSPIGQAPQAVAYVSNAVPEGEGLGGLQPPGIAAGVTHLSLRSVTDPAEARHPSSVSLFDQGLTQVVEAAVSGLKPGAPYVLALSTREDGAGVLQPLSAFIANPAGAAIVNAVGPVRQLLQQSQAAPRQYLAVVAGTPGHLGPPVQVQVREDESR